MAGFFLGFNQGVAHLRVPLLPHLVPVGPWIAAVLPQDLRAVVVGVDVVSRRAEVRYEFYAPLERRVLVLPAEIHSAEQADAGGALSLAGVGVAVFGAAVGLHAVEVFYGALDRGRIDGEVGHVAA